MKAVSFERRDLLAEKCMDLQPELRSFLRPNSGNPMTGSWEFLAYSFERGFEEMWDRAQLDRSRSVLDRPLLMLWRQSVELHIKSAIAYMVGDVKGGFGHDLNKLFIQLLRERAILGYCDDNDLTRCVQIMIAEVQSFDPFADRFRYPNKRNGQPFEDIEIDLDHLFQAHWMITTWCQGAEIEVEQSRGIF
ncbi:hypothetical protein [Acetobacter sp.]|jgi:HEPN domain-containing protein|uniref:hypothetical protein n=1 Tax=Acetobacter sp. TaxID=440 RepID=UPI0025C2563F|nr:hypothetical protein [Acetobacter sp.]MCH4089878.1 hypothetical protein [Acetobacter sp.]MCI1298574.1 hypothetical protein [Acetobacter sp.]MCI1315139.1 hypothetical protein [Acetobacter sp.]